MKENVCFCEQCARCRSPTRYCKFRQACSIWFSEGRDRSPVKDTRGNR